MGSLDGRVAIITGAGRGLGREHALLFASEGAKVVVNDLGDAAEAVAEEIRATGGEATASTHDITSWDDGPALIAQAVDGFGRLDVLVNNAGILRDRMLVSMSEAEWDDIIAVHLKGHFVPTRFAAAHWREQVKAGAEVQASIIHTSSTSGLIGNPGQTNYGAAKAGIGAFSIICAQELAHYGVRSNCIAPAARTRLTEATPGLGDMVAAPAEGFDIWDPANVSPLVAYLATAD
ncbi:MAG: SDR family NAD(P)-dependent oxidoreductase, partial [Acidimicrobiales bacterium]